MAQAGAASQSSPSITERPDHILSPLGVHQPPLAPDCVQASPPAGGGATPDRGHTYAAAARSALSSGTSSPRASGPSWGARTEWLRSRRGNAGGLSLMRARASAEDPAREGSRGRGRGGAESQRCPPGFCSPAGGPRPGCQAQGGTRPLSALHGHCFMILMRIP